MRAPPVIETASLDQPPVAASCGAAPSAPLPLPLPLLLPLPLPLPLLLPLPPPPSAGGALHTIVEPIAKPATMNGAQSGVAVSVHSVDDLQS
jgi:hypothetical protein